jgi:hypothetical protein
MKVVLQTMMLFFSTFLLASCYNRIQEYQPYSTFDERMAEARMQEERQPSFTRDPYAYAEDNDYQDNGSYLENQFNEPANRSVQPRQFARGPSGRVNENKSSSDTEVPFNNSRGPKQPANIGAM